MGMVLIDIPATLQNFSRFGTRAYKFLNLLPNSKGSLASDVAANSTGIDAWNDSASELLLQMLAFDPDRRLTAHEGVRLGYFCELHDSSDEPVILSALSRIIAHYSVSSLSFLELCARHILYLLLLHA